MRYEPEPSPDPPAEDSGAPSGLQEPGVPPAEEQHEALGGGSGLRNVDLPDVQSGPGEIKRGRGRPRKAGSSGPAETTGDQPPAAVGGETQDFHLNIPWETVPFAQGEAILQRLREETTFGSRILQGRLNAESNVVVLCSNPVCQRPIRNGAWVARHTHRDQRTGLEQTITSCSERCFLVNQKAIQRPAPEHKTGGLVRG